MYKKFISTKMKIFLLILFILCIIFYTSGCIVLIQSNYNLSNYSDEVNLNFIPSSFKYNFDFGNNFLNFTNSYTSHDYSINDNISEIDFNMNAQDIEIINSNSKTLNIKIRSFSSSDNTLNMSENNNKLTFSPTVDIPENSTIIISVPSDFAKKSTLKLTTSSGDITVNNFSANTFNASSASGDIDLTNSDFNYLYLSSSSGDIDMNTVNSYLETNLSCLSGSIDGGGCLGILTGRTASGDITLTLKNKLNNVFLSTASGDVELSLPSESSYEINYSTLSGSNNSSDSILANGDKNAKINVNTISGDLDIIQN